jgi:hypothetical protein
MVEFGLMALEEFVCLSKEFEYFTVEGQSAVRVRRGVVGMSKGSKFNEFG